jgi:phosphoserine phosphatase RsbU/P
MTSPVEKRLVLVVDDAPANLQMVHSILKQDFKVRVATSGSKALELAQSHPQPDLILLDVEMPEMNGYEVCGRLKATPETKDIPVIFLTRRTDVEAETRGFEVGAVDYIHKPFSPAVVKARVNTHLVLREARAQLSRQLAVLNSEMEMARQIQLSILPHHAPKISGLEIAARCIPMTSVAGDFYDFIVVDEKHVGILVADVSGHGLPSALIASMLKVGLAAQAPHASDPAKVLSGLNQSLCGKFRSSFVTAAYVFIDMEELSLSYAGAGHPPLLLWRSASGVVVEMEENGLPLGLFAGGTYSAIEVPVGAGDKVLLCTDGILETSSPSEQEFGLDLFKGFLGSNHALEAEAFIDFFLEVLSDWSERPQGEGQEDDLTVLVAAFGVSSLVQ